jgi:hypothetical protein
MILVEVWKANGPRCGGRFNLYFFWMYPLAIPFCLTWDLLSWAERALTPRGSDNG